MKVSTSATVSNDIFEYRAQWFTCMSASLNNCKVKLRGAIYKVLQDKFCTALYEYAPSKAPTIRQNEEAFSSLVLSHLGDFTEKTINGCEKSGTGRYCLTGNKQHFFTEEVGKVANIILSQSKVSVLHKVEKSDENEPPLKKTDKVLLKQWHDVWNPVLNIPEGIDELVPIYIDTTDEAWYQYFRLWVYRAPLSHPEFLSEFFSALKKPGVNIYMALVYTISRLASAHKPESIYKDVEANLYTPTALLELIENKKAGHKQNEFLACEAMNTNFNWSFDECVLSFIRRKNKHYSSFYGAPPYTLLIEPYLSAMAGPISQVINVIDSYKKAKATAF